jgi:hypothetical protein
VSAAQTGAAVAPALLIGAPPLITGTIDVVNETAESARIPRARVVLDPGGGGTGVPGALRVQGRALPGMRSRLDVYLTVEAGTPPGTYHTELDALGAKRPVDVRVLEHVDVRVTPSSIQVRAAAGEAIAADLVVTNHGNVEQTLPRAAVVFFEESAWLGRSLVFALRDTGADEGWQRYGDHLVHELRTTMAETTAVQLTAPVASLPPGGETLVHLAATLPGSLAKGRTYLAFFSFAGTHVEIEAIVNGAANSTKRRPA